MRKIVLLFLSSFIFSSLILAQTIIENPEKPLSKNAGRVLNLKKIWRISDEGGDFYFRSPRKLQIASDGNIFVADRDALLKFSPEGKFIKNLYRKGQGPGEIESYFNYYIHRNKIHIYDFTGIKVIQTDLEGNFIHQIKIISGPYNGFLGATENWYVFTKEIPPPISEYKNKLYDLKCAVKLVSKNGKIEKDSHAFPRKVFLHAKRGRTSWVMWFRALSDDAKRLYVSHTSEYLVEALDLEKGQINKRFNRKYPRIKYTEQGWEDEFYKRYDVPKIKFESDILGLFVNKDLLWVKTSTKDKKKGQMIDVFNSSGMFVDNFYLGFEGELMAAHGNFIYALEKDVDENLFIVKYKIIEQRTNIIQ